MTKEFIPYEQALELTALGFNEECLAVVNVNSYELKIINGSYNEELYLPIPLYQQTFRWFREKHILHAEPYTIDMGKIEYSFCIRDLYSEKYIYDNFKGAGNSYWGTFDTYEEAELDCLKKLIEIVKQTKNN
jgi:hypothetical protein